MRGGLGRGLSFKNVNGSCLIDCTLNSILNSHEIIKKLYEFAPSNTSLNWTYNKILKSDDYNGIATIYECLLSAYVHDYINNTNNIDKDKILFTSIREKDITKLSSLNDVAKFLQKEYVKYDFSKTVRLNSFMISSTGLANFKVIRTINTRGFYRTLKDTLLHFKDIYIYILFYIQIEKNSKEQ